MSFDGNVSIPQDLLKAWCETKQSHDRDRLVMQYLPLVRRLCRKFANLGEPLEDLIQVGAIGLLKAIQKFDPDRGNNLAAFARTDEQESAASLTAGARSRLSER